LEKAPNNRENREDIQPENDSTGILKRFSIIPGLFPLIVKMPWQPGESGSLLNFGGIFLLSPRVFSASMC
jgi:hypothetical protein